MLQPLVGPTVSCLVKEALEDKVRTGLEELSQGLGDAIEGAEGTPGWAEVIGDWARTLHHHDAQSIDV